MFLGADFISVSKADLVEWAVLKPAVLGAIMEHFTRGLPVMADDAELDGDADGPDVSDPVVQQIQELLDTRVRPAVGGPGFFKSQDAFSWYLFAGAEGRAVGRNLFLEGNTFDQRDGVTINRLVADFQLGAAVRVGPVEMSYTHVLRTEEYAAQDGFAEFGSINIRTAF